MCRCHVGMYSAIPRNRAASDTFSIGTSAFLRRAAAFVSHVTGRWRCSLLLAIYTQLIGIVYLSFADQFSVNRAVVLYLRKQWVPLVPVLDIAYTRASIVGYLYYFNRVVRRALFAETEVRFFF